jgi:beta-fructofuranosidase
VHVFFLHAPRDLGHLDPGGRARPAGRAGHPPDDLVTWERQPLVVEADPRWYEASREHPLGEEFWRDPWVFQDPGDGRYHMVVCARANHGPSHGRGFLGHASSTDLCTWKAGPPGRGRRGRHPLPGRRQPARPYALGRDRDAFLLGDPHVSYYAGRVLHHQSTWWLFAWRHADGQGRFLGELSDPIP